MDKNIFRNSGGGLEFSVYLSPCSKKDEITGVLHRDQKTYVKISVTARPVDNQANEHLIKFIASEFKIAKSFVSIKNGHTSRYKTILVNNVNDIPDSMSRLTQSGQMQYNFEG
jgi:uncharacterized protein (TIGR00251 family)